MLLEALSRLGVSKDEAIFVGDGDADINAASNAGLPCISVCYGYRTEEFLKKHGGQVFAHNVRELAHLLGICID
ncbi:MAG: HAD hydrolase-like protein, partial [Clostridia bacterium]|nr:HAD hydrolase-like protein [Clostridia bacterium]